MASLRLIPDMDRHRIILLLPLDVIAGAAALAYLNLNRERRIETLEAELASRPAMFSAIAQPMPSTSTGTGFSTAIPITRPHSSKTIPPLLLAFTGASVWMNMSNPKLGFPNTFDIRPLVTDSVPRR